MTGIAGLGPAQVAELQRAGDRLSLVKGDLLWVAGAACEAFFVIRSGDVNVDGADLAFDGIRVLGCLDFLRGGSHASGATATSPCELTRLSGLRARRLLESDAGLARALVGLELARAPGLGRVDREPGHAKKPGEGVEHEGAGRLSAAASALADRTRRSLRDIALEVKRTGSVLPSRDPVWRAMDDLRSGAAALQATSGPDAERKGTRRILSVELEPFLSDSPLADAFLRRFGPLFGDASLAKAMYGAEPLELASEMGTHIEAWLRDQPSMRACRAGPEALVDHALPAGFSGNILCVGFRQPSIPIGPERAPSTGTRPTTGDPRLPRPAWRRWTLRPNPRTRLPRIPAFPQRHRLAWRAAAPAR